MAGLRLRSRGRNANARPIALFDARHSEQGSARALGWALLPAPAAQHSDQVEYFGFDYIVGDFRKGSQKLWCGRNSAKLGQAVALGSLPIRGPPRQPVNEGC